MPRFLLVATLILLCLAAIACGSDDKTPAATVATSVAGRTASATPGDQKTPGPSDTGEATPVTSGSNNETPRATAPFGTPAVHPADEDAFLKQFEGVPVIQEPCTYDPAFALTTCPNRGLYAVDPPLTGQDITCALLVVNNVPKGVQCHSAQPLETRNYEIKG